MCVNGEETLHVDRFMIDVGILSYPADFPDGNVDAISINLELSSICCNFCRVFI